MAHYRGAPTMGSERTPVIDVLRGVALFGVLLVNVVTEFRVSLFQAFVRPAPSVTVTDWMLGRALSLAVEFKAFILFSLLFGVGLAIQEERARKGGRSFGVYVVRRHVALLGLGLVHLFLIWNGDILTLYAVLALLAAPLVGRSPRTLLALAMACFVVQLMPLPYPAPFADAASLRHHVMAAGHVYADGGFLDVLWFRVAEVRPISTLLVSIAPRTLGLFFLGAYAWRARLFTRDVAGLRPLLLAITVVMVGGALVFASTSAIPPGTLQDVASGGGPIVLALGYAGVVLTAYARPLGAKLLGYVAPLGRMALTNYLSQSVIMGFIFYGYGLGQFGKLGVVSAGALCIVVYAAQAVASTIWLRHYELGPAEWVWRCVTYGARQPMLRARPSR